MNEIELISRLARDNGISLSRIALDNGLSRNAITKARSVGASMSTRNTSTVLASMGYALCAVPVDHVPDGALVIDDGDSDESND